MAKFVATQFHREQMREKWELFHQDSDRRHTGVIMCACGSWADYWAQSEGKVDAYCLDCEPEGSIRR